MKKNKKNKKNEVVTLKDILKRKEFFENKKNQTKELFVKSLGGNIVISKPDKELCVECIDMEDSIEGDKYFVYEIVKQPNLQDTGLHEAFGIKVPTDIVDKIFDAGEISNIAKEGLRFAGYLDSVEVVEDLKN